MSRSVSPRTRALLLTALVAVVTCGGSAAWSTPRAVEGAPLLMVTPTLFSLIVKGSIVGLVLATLVIVAIWIHEMRHDQTW